MNPRLGHTESTHYVVELKIASVKKGKGIQAGDLLYVRLIQEKWNVDAEGKTESPTEGHTTIPAKGNAIRAYLRQAKDKGYDAIKPNGCKVVSKKK